MRTMLALGVLALAALGAGAAPIPKENKKTLPEKLAGEWRMVKTDAEFKPEYTFSIHFKKDGLLEFHRQYPDQEESVQTGKYKTTDPDEKNPDGTIDWTIVVGEGRTRGEISKILKINDDELVFEDPAGLKESFVRVKVKKKDADKDK